MIRAKTFFKALSQLETAPKKVKAYLNDRRLTLSEKTILKCWMDLRDNKIEAAKKSVESISTNSDSAIESQRLLLMGILEINSSNPKKAIPLIDRSIVLLESLPLPDYLFRAASNSFVAHLNLKNLKGMQRALKLQGQIKPLSELQTNQYLLNQFNFEKFNGNTLKAIEQSDLLHHRERLMSENQMIQFCISDFDLKIKIGAISECEALLKKLKKLKKFNISPNFKYIRTLLDHLTKNKPVYMYSKDFGKFPNLGAQMGVIHSLEAGNRKEALKHWQTLSALNPEIYQGEFAYKGDISLFSLCLEKHLFKDSIQNEGSVSNQKDIALMELLRRYNRPISKDELYLKLWGEQPRDKSDFNKLERVVSRVRKTKGLKIKSRRGTYYLE